MDIIAQKKKLRGEIRNRKLLLAIEEKETEADFVFNEIETLEIFIKATKVMIYWAMPDELPTQRFIQKWRDKKQIFLPRIVGNEIDVRLFENAESLEDGSYKGVKEPTGELIDDVNNLDLIIVPGIAFDKSGNRLGRGGGFYDRLFTKVPDAIRIGVGFQCQLVMRLHCEPHDIKMHKIIISI